MTDSPKDTRGAQREARDWAALADVIEGVWRTRWGSVPVVAAVIIEEIRRGGRGTR